VPGNRRSVPGDRRPYLMPRKATVMLDTDPRTDAPVALPTDEQVLVRLTGAAAAKLGELTADEQSPEIGLRVYVYGGGCSGLHYGMMLDDQPTPDDARTESRGVRIYVDAESRQYLAGSEIDYVETAMGAGFTVNNPNPVAGCGCGGGVGTADSECVPGSCSH
jgi:iron-sulfur cluster assembly accessory protein